MTKLIRDPLSADFKSSPYWLEDAPLVAFSTKALPARADVVVIGAGYTGLSAALTLARGGRDVVAIDAMRPGEGASTANAGNISPILKKTLSLMEDSQASGDDIACCREAVTAFEFVKDFIAREELECQAKWTGRFYAAHSPKAYETLAKVADTLPRHTGLQVALVPRAEQGRHVGSDGFFGGLAVEGTGRLHAGLYQRGLMERARSAGARIFSNVTATQLSSDRGGHTVRTARGDILARNVIVATNGYTALSGLAFPYLNRRVVPVDAYGSMTEEISPEIMEKILPSLRTILETKTVNFYVQPSPDHKRLFLGGHTGRKHNDLRIVARAIHAYGSRLFPDLRPIKVTHCWTAKMAFTFDYLPHAGSHDGVHFAIGMCATGVTNGVYLGHKTALNVMGKADTATAFHRKIPTIPFYSGNAWFMPALSRYYTLRDSFWT